MSGAKTDANSSSSSDIKYQGDRVFNGRADAVRGLLRQWLVQQARDYYISQTNVEPVLYYYHIIGAPEHIVIGNS